MFSFEESKKQMASTIHDLQTYPRYYSLCETKRLWPAMARVTFIFLIVIHTSSAQGEENKCEVYTSENCTQKVRCKIEEKSVEKRRSFTLLLKSSTGEETVAELSFVGYYKCEAARSYTCDKETETIFSITLSCTARGEFTLSDDENTIPCMRAQMQRSSSELNKNIYKKNDTIFQTDNAEENKHITDAAIGVSVCLFVVILTVICFLKRKVIFEAVRKIRIKEVKKDCDDAELALNSNNTTNQTTTQDKLLSEQECDDKAESHPEK